MEHRVVIRAAFPALVGVCCWLAWPQLGHIHSVMPRLVRCGTPSPGSRALENKAFPEPATPMVGGA